MEDIINCIIEFITNNKIATAITIIIGLGTIIGYFVSEKFKLFFNKLFHYILYFITLCIPHGFFLLLTHKKKNRNLLLKKIDESIYCYYEDNNDLYYISRKNEYIFKYLNFEGLFERDRRTKDAVIITKDEVDRLKGNIKQGYYDDELKKILKNKQV